MRNAFNDKTIDHTQIPPELFNKPERNMGTRDVKHLDIQLESTSGGYRSFITVMNVFSSFSFAYPVINSFIVNKAKITDDFFTKTD